MKEKEFLWLVNTGSKGHYREFLGFEEEKLKSQNDHSSTVVSV